MTDNNDKIHETKPDSVATNRYRIVARIAFATIMVVIIAAAIGISISIGLPLWIVIVAVIILLVFGGLVVYFGEKFAKDMQGWDE